MPFTIYLRLGLDTPRPITMRILITDRSIRRLVRVLFNVFMKVDFFILLADFVVLNCEIN